MLYTVEDTEYCMLNNHKRGTLYYSLRYGIARGSLETKKIYDCRNRKRVRQIYKNIKRYRKVENSHRLVKHKDNTCEVRSTHEGKPRGEMYKKPDSGDSRGKLKYVHLIPHETCIGNFMVLEIIPREIDENNNSVPETTAKRKVTRATKPKRITNSPRHSRTRDPYNKVISTLQVPNILKAKTSVLWEIYKQRRKLKTFSQR